MSSSRPLGTDATAGGAAEQQRTAHMAARLADLGLDALVVAEGADLRYLTGFTGSSGLALVAADGTHALSSHRFLTDFRYETQSAEQVPGVYEREIASVDLLEAAGKAIAASSGRLGFDDATMSVRSHRRLGEAAGEGWELIPAGGEVGRLRAVKDAGELARIRAAAELADSALQEVLEGGLAGRSEREVALEIELRMRRLGAQAPSFDSIVASGAHGALPHAEPRDAEITRDVLVTIDWGALLDGYCSDCTRTFATGEGISDREREVYELVREAQQAGLDGLRVGISGRDADAAAREVIEAAGFGEQFGHGLGHGVGLEIHEPPRLSRKEGAASLEAGNVVTVEPGVYVPGEFGVRIEDLVAVGEGSNDIFTGLSKDLIVIE
jgi:Xaa-Pro aminopeptidase